MNLELRKFDISTIKKHSVCVIIGKRGTGKTVLVKDILYNNYNNIKEKTIISPIDNYDIFPDLVINRTYNPDILSNVISKCKSNDKSNDESLLILDNCLCSSCFKDTNMISLCMNGRHYKLNVIITMPYALSIPIKLRSNVEFVFIFRENNVSNRKRLYEHYAGLFPTFEEFCQVMDKCTEDYNCLVINNITESNKLEDRVFWYKAELH